jgi:hypothetical protein
VANQFGEQQFDYIIIKDSLAISDTATVISNRDTIYLFYHPEQLSASDSLYQGLINPLIVKSIPLGEYGFVPKPKTQFIPNWTIILIVSLFLLLALIRSTSETYIPQLFQSVFNKKIANRLFRERTTTFFNSSFLLDTFFTFITGIFIFQVVNHFSEFTPTEGLVYCGLFVFVFLMYLVVKFSLYRISGTIFETYSETQEYLFHAKTGNRVMGIILFPIVLFLFIVDGDFAEYLIYSGIVLMVILNIINILRGMIIIAQKVFSVYYMILYLCTLEILPLLLVWKILEIM